MLTTTPWATPLRRAASMTTEAHQRQPPVVVMTPRLRECPMRERPQVAGPRSIAFAVSSQRNQQGEQAVNECGADGEAADGENCIAPPAKALARSLATSSSMPILRSGGAQESMPRSSRRGAARAQGDGPTRGANRVAPAPQSWCGRTLLVLPGTWGRLGDGPRERPATRTERQALVVA